MKKFIPYEKLSKKEKKKFNAERRVGWQDYGQVSPVTKRVESKKHKEEKYKKNWEDYVFR